MSLTQLLPMAAQHFLIIIVNLVAEASLFIVQKWVRQSREFKVLHLGLVVEKLVFPGSSFTISSVSQLLKRLANRLQLTTTLTVEILHYACFH